MKKILIIIVLLISSFSFYGVVNENGEKVTNVNEILEMQNTTQQEKELQEDTQTELQDKEKQIGQETKGETKEDKTETKQEVKEEIKQVAKIETKQENKVEVKQEKKTETEPKTENKTEAKQENKAEVKQEEKTEQKIEDKTETNTQTKQENKELANTTYRKVNTEVVPKVINILNDEIAKDEELKNFGTKAIKGTKEQVSSTSGFTYMFVKNIEKGKVAGNYTIFEQRVRNTVGAFGKYYVYAEDEYVYNSTGTESHWYQTLVWVYITF